ncbi:hypothetical protein CL654_02475 [bacterium]|nr:hypothetical protein [bacterium]|tara:strand:- start:2758 stop:3150 length:393 start_codon:yes stop_codon:yes gene_type:complete
MTDCREADIAWLKEMERKIHNEGGWGCHQLRTEEWARVDEITRRLELPCQLVSNVLGFELRIYKHGPMFGIVPDLLIRIDCNQHPYHTDAGDQLRIAEELFGLTHTARNKEVLRWYGLEPQKEKPEDFIY